MSCTVCSRNCGTTSALKEHLRSEHSQLNSDELNNTKSQESSNSDSNKDSKTPTITLKSSSSTENLKKEKSETTQDEKKDDSSKSEESDEIRINQSSKLISNLLGTKPDVIDDILTSKSTSDAAKLLGVR